MNVVRVDDKNIAALDRVLTVLNHEGARVAREIADLELGVPVQIAIGHAQRFDMARGDGNARVFEVDPSRKSGDGRIRIL